jgi:hypothetical protein
MAPKRLPQTGDHGVPLTRPINCVGACDATQARLAAGPVRGSRMADGRPWGRLFGLLSVPRCWR